MAKTTSLRCRLLEGKDLPAKDVSGSSDPYCVVKVDNEVVARTATVWKSLNPFWGEEITLLLPRGFNNLTIYVLDEDTIGQDDVIGKVSLSHQQISAEPRGIDSWLSLAPVSPDQEVQGEIHLELRVPEWGHPRVLRCHLIEARDLAPRDPSGTSDPFGRVSCCGHTLETAVMKKTRFPRWDEVLEFELPEGELGEAVLSVEVWDWDIVGKNDFLGRVEFFLGTLCPGPTRGWFQLLPFPSTTEDRRGQLGALRLTVKLLEDTVLPPHHYQPLIQLLTEPVLCPAQSPEGTALAVLEEVTSGESRQDVATQLVKIFLGQGLAVPLLDYLTTRELARTTDPNTLFRSNSLASKCVEQFMKEDLLQGVPVAGAGAGEQPAAAEGLPGGHRGCHRGLGGQVSPPHEGGLQAAPQAGGGAIPLGAARGGPILLHQWVPLPSLLRSRCPHPEALRALGAARRARHRPHAAAARQGSADHREPGAAAGAGQGAVDGPAERCPPAQCHPGPALPGCPGHRGRSGRGASATGTVPTLGHHQGGSPAHLPRGEGDTAAPLCLQEEALQAQHPGPGLCQGAPGAGARLHPSGADPGSGAGGQRHLPAPPRPAGGGTGWHRAAPHHLPPVQGPPAQTATCCPPVTPAPSAPAAGPAACSPRVPVGPGVPWARGAREGGVGVAVSPLLSLAVPGCSRTHGAVALGEWSHLGDPAVAAQSLYGHLRAALAGGPVGSAVAGPPCPGQAAGLAGDRLQEVLRDLDIAHDAFTHRDETPEPAPSPLRAPRPPAPPRPPPSAQAGAAEGTRGQQPGTGCIL
nr:rasGAP-activating-like protein 1 isoform X5 [Taeniopygia guttata]